MTTFIASLLPIALYLLVLMLMDGFALARWSKVINCAIAGVCSCLIMLLITKVSTLSAGNDFSLVPLFEEILKAAFIIYLILSRRIRFMAEAIIYGAAIGGGFALLENVIYLLANPDMHLATAIVRGMSTAILHIGCTSLIACMLMLLKNERQLWLMTIVSFVPSILIHFIHNYLHEVMRVPAIYIMAALIILFLFLIRLFFKIGNSKIYNWIDHSVSYDIQTLSAIRRGDFASTKSGEYLLSVKNQFQPEVFFDMLCYIETYLDVKIEKQSLMLLYETGFKSEEFDKVYQKHLDKKTELEALTKTIGITGMSVLRPLILDAI